MYKKTSQTYKKTSSRVKVVTLLTAIVIAVSLETVNVPLAHAATTGVATVPIVVDNFNDNAGDNTGFTGNDGINNWTGSWTEIGETGGNIGPSNGDVQVQNGERGFLSIQGPSNGASRAVDLSGIASASTISLVLEYRIAQTLESGNVVTIEVNDGSGWITPPLGTITGSSSSTYTRLSFDIKAYATATTQIRLMSDSSNSTGDDVYFRYIAIMYPDSTRNYCYLVADRHNDTNTNSDLLTIVDQTTGAEAPIGSGTETSTIETNAFQPGTTTLYTVNAGNFGTIDLQTGLFSSIGSVGTGSGSLGNITFSDVDSLSFDPFTGVLYGVHRRGGDPNPDDILLQINPGTGAYVAGAFGTGVDYVVIPSGGTTNWADIDDIAVSSYDGRLYAIANANGTNDELVVINETTGAITAKGALGVNDMEGLGFDVEGNLFGATGSTPESLYDIDDGAGTASNQRTLSAGEDYEAADCLTWGTNEITGTVYHDDNLNQTLDGGEARTANVTVRLYRDVNGDGLVDAGDILLATEDTDSNGDYAFGFAAGVGAIGDFVIDIDTGDVPTGHTLTTDNKEEAVFTDVGNTDANNNYGHAAPMDLGDLPANYNNTLLGEDGPRHQIGSLVLGSTIGAETEGQPDDNAGADTGDDGVTRMPGRDGSSNDGGWTEGTVIGGEGGSLEITISGDNGIPQVFMDFNGDGTLTEVTLRDVNGTAITGAQTGLIRVYFDIPTGTFDSQTNPIPTRVRLSSAGGLTPTGYAADGEVEDYVWNFGPTAVSLQNIQAASNASLLIVSAVGFVMLALGSASFYLVRYARIKSKR